MAPAIADDLASSDLANELASDDLADEQAARRAFSAQVREQLLESVNRRPASYHGGS
jgi:hypothetical protein